LPRAQGVIVQSVVKDGAAESAGVLEKDIILSVDSREVNQANELQSYVASRRPGDVVTLKLYRDGKNIEKKVTLKPRNDESDVITASNNKDETNETDKDSPEVADFDKLGMSVRAMTDGEQDAAKVDHGVVVASVKPYSEAFERNIREKLVILEADNKPVRSPKDLKNIFEGKKPGDSVLLRMKSPSGASFFTAVEIPSL
jgi:serine protease Do